MNQAHRCPAAFCMWSTAAEESRWRVRAEWEEHGRRSYKESTVGAIRATHGDFEDRDESDQSEGGCRRYRRNWIVRRWSISGSDLIDWWLVMGHMSRVTDWKKTGLELLSQFGCMCRYTLCGSLRWLERMAMVVWPRILSMTGLILFLGLVLGPKVKRVRVSVQQM